jgi:hypothetical protein
MDLHTAIYPIPNHNHLFIEFSSIKPVLHKNNYDNIIAFLMAHINFMIASYSSFELHINLDKFVLSDFHHHQQLIKNICQYCFASSQKIDVICIYNSPSILNIISPVVKPFIDKSVNDKIKIFPKDTEYMDFIKN